MSSQGPALPRQHACTGEGLLDAILHAGESAGGACAGEHWDVSEQMDTYYNPVPHFGYKLALEHSPTLKRVPTLPRGGDDLEGGIDDL